MSNLLMTVACNAALWGGWLAEQSSGWALILGIVAGAAAVESGRRKK